MQTNHRLNVYDSEHPAECTCCKHPSETENHIIRCRSDKKSIIREKWIREMNIFFNKQHISTAMKQCVLKNATASLNDEPPCNHDSQKTRHLARDQGRIGRDHFLRGRIALSWRREIHDHLQRNQIKNITAEQWGATY
jgi:hypothetical protein